MKQDIKYILTKTKSFISPKEVTFYVMKLIIFKAQSISLEKK